MHYFKRNIGDYHKKAGRLTMLEHGAYTLLLDSCYDRERFPTFDDAVEWCWARSEAEIEAVHFVLSKFFTLTDGLYVQNRISEEIDKYHSNSATNKRIALEREESRRTKRERNVHEAPPNQEPLTINQEPLTKTSKSKDLSKPSALTAKKGTRLPEDWKLLNSWREWAAAEKPNWTDDDIRRVSEDFRDFWIAKAGKDAVKMDWLATWRKWVRSPINEINHSAPSAPIKHKCEFYGCKRLANTRTASGHRCVDHIAK